MLEVGAAVAEQAGSGSPPLEVLEQLAWTLGDSATALSARGLRARTDEGRFYVACLGQFKRGKSTLINALIARPVLPAGVVPLTSVPTVVRAGPFSARVQRAGGQWEEIAPARIEDFVSERGNPGNEQGIRLVEVFSESPLLASGMCLVDMPGVGSVIEANTEATRGFVPHVDVALVVVGVDPPISGEELALVEEVARQCPHLIVVLNKADRFPKAEREEARAFAATALARRLGRTPEVLEVSALERLEGGPGGAGFEALVTTLKVLADGSGAGLVRAAERRGVSGLAAILRRELDLRRRALMQPLADSEARLDALRRALGDAERGLKDLGALLREQEQLLRGALEAHRVAFLSRQPRPSAALTARMAWSGTRSRRRLREALNDAAQREAREAVERWQAEEQPAVDALYQEAMQRFVALGNRFLARLEVAAGEGAGSLGPPLEPPLLEARSRLYFTDLMRLTAPPLPRRVVERFGPPGLARRWILEDARRYLTRLIDANSSRLQFDLDDRVRESREQLERTLRVRLSAAVSGGERALDAARAAAAHGAEAIAEELARLERLRAQLDHVAPLHAPLHDEELAP